MTEAGACRDKAVPSLFHFHTDNLSLGSKKASGKSIIKLHLISLPGPNLLGFRHPAAAPTEQPRCWFLVWT